MAASARSACGARTHSPRSLRPSGNTVSTCSTDTPDVDGPHVAMTVATIWRDSHKPQDFSGGSTALICRKVIALAVAAARERSDPRVGTIGSTAGVNNKW